MLRPNLKSVPEIIAIGVLGGGWVANLNLGEEAVAGRGW